MSGDCSHGWGYHSQGASGPCDLCEAEDRAKRKIIDDYLTKCEHVMITLHEGGLIQLTNATELNLVVGQPTLFVKVRK